MKLTYILTRNTRAPGAMHLGKAECEVFNEETGNHEALIPDESQAVYNHSPDGFEWGYAGSGPAQLALAILLHYNQAAMPDVSLEARRRMAQLCYQEFKRQFIATIPAPGGIITSNQIRTFLQNETR